MTPRWDLLRPLYARLAAKPDHLIDLGCVRYRSSCGTVACVFGELCADPAVQSLGITLAVDRDYFHMASNRYRPAFTYVMDHGEHALFGLTYVEAHALFGAREREGVPQKQEALERLEELFASHNEPLFLEEAVEA